MTLVKISLEDIIEQCIKQLSEARGNVRVKCMDANQLYQLIRKSKEFLYKIEEVYALNYNKYLANNLK